MRFSDLEKLHVKNKSGKRLGKVNDIHTVLSSSGFKIKEIHFGTMSILERLGLLTKGDKVIEWKKIVEIKEDSIVINERDVRNNEE